MKGLTGLTSKQPSILLAKRTIPHGIRYSDGKSLDTIHLWQKESLQNMENKNTINYSNMLSVYKFSEPSNLLSLSCKMIKKDMLQWLDLSVQKKMILVMGKWHI